MSYLNNRLTERHIAKEYTEEEQNKLEKRRGGRKLTFKNLASYI